MTKPENKSSRKLAAILFADVVGYTALMQKDEKAASIWLKRFQNLINEEVNKHNGQIVNFYGDGALCTFQSPLVAMNCSIQLQSQFQQQPGVPVRIGIHSGTVVTEGDKVYGDSVNIASRIESMGIPGAILVSKKVRDELKNQPDISLPSLGQFEFKNVDEPIEVFALANEGFAVPKKEEIEGKFKNDQRKYPKWLYPASIASIILIVFLSFAWWNSATNKSFDLESDISIEPSSTLLSKSDREKKVAVMVFENRTGSEKLEDFGSMISDWLTRGLMETGEANIISMSRISEDVALAGVGSKPNPQLASRTGVDIMIQGNYYLQEELLIIHGNVVNVRSGQVIHAIPQIDGPRKDMLKLLNRLTEEVLSYWAIKGTRRFSKNPPKYEAYQSFKEGENMVYTDFKKAESLLLQSFQQDTNFYAPLLKLIPVYRNKGRGSSADSIVTFISERREKLSPWEKLRIDALLARRTDIVKSAELNLKMFEMDESDLSSHYNAVSRYLQANYPHKAIEVGERRESRYQDLNDKVSWSEERMALAYNRIGEFEKAIEAVNSYSFPEMYAVLPFQHFRALIALDSMEALEVTVRKYLKMDLYDQDGEIMHNANLYYALCAELILGKKENIGALYFNEYLDFVSTMSEGRRKNTHEILANYFLKNYDEVIKKIESLLQDVPDSGYKANLLAILGGAYAKSGIAEKAEQILAELQRVEFENRLSEEYVSYCSARIYSALDKKEEALEALKFAEEGMIFFRGDMYHEDPFFVDLLDYPPFMEFVKPRG